MQLLKGVVRAYDWGDHRAIAEILGHEPPGSPEAEYWLGAHPGAPSSVVGRDRTLDDLVAGDPASMVGPKVGERFAGLPYLLKILAAAQPLSIQAHPSLDQAKLGFAEEEAAGIDRSAPNRNYRDANHKPELICAITPFEAKCGFRAVADSRRLLASLGDARLDELAARLATDGSDAEILSDVVAWLLRLPAGPAAGLADAARDGAIAKIHSQSESDSESEPESGSQLEPPAEFASEYEWTVRIAKAFPGDIGVVVALLLNHVSLAPGQAIFLEAGNLHSYLQGVGVELMANSDNVLRGGLTSKHIDVEQLLGVVQYEPANAPVQTPSDPVHQFEVPVPEFGLTRLDSTIGELDQPCFTPVGPEIILVTSGALTLVAADGEVEVPTGGAAFIGFADGPYRVVDQSSGTTVAWRAAVGNGV